MRRLILLLAFLLAGPAFAEGFLDAEGFDAATRGKTYSYSSGGAPYGAEEYLPNRRVRWSFLDGECLDGVWWQEGDFICFEYQDDPEPHCWTFQQGPSGLVATLSSEEGGRVLYEVEQSDKPLMCLGPKVGV